MKPIPDLKRSARCLSLIAATVVTLSACRAEHNVRKYSIEIRKMADTDGPIPAKEISTRYDKNLARYSQAESIVSLSSSALRDLFDATFTTAFSGANPKHAKALGTVAAELSARGQLQPQDARDLQGVFILVRDFDGARRLKVEHPNSDLETIPKVLGTPSAEGPSAMELSPDGAELQIRHLSQVPGPRIVIVSSLSCGPSNRALMDIKQDPTMRAIFEKHASWVMPPQSILDAEKMTKWNAQNPGLQFSHAYSPAGWQGIDTWTETPVFYFLMNGKQKAKIFGWPKAGRRDELRAGLKSIGLL